MGPFSTKHFFLQLLQIWTGRAFWFPNRLLRGEKYCVVHLMKRLFQPARDATVRMQRLRALLDDLSSSSSDDDEPESPKRRDAEGRLRRRGGWQHPQPQQNPDGRGVGKWRCKYQLGHLWRLLQNERTYDSTSYWGKRFRSDLGVPPLRGPLVYFWLAGHPC